MADEIPTETVAEIDSALADWRQGDFVVDQRWFVHIADLKMPLTLESKQAGAQDPEAGPSAVTYDVEGLVVITQTCDIVRNCSQRSFVEVAPLVKVDDQMLEHIHKGRYPAYAGVPGASDRNLVADLDRTMTIEKALMAKWNRLSGCRNDEESRQFSWALARKRSRFAFPDDFRPLMLKFQERLKSKHSKDSPEGHALRAIRQIRVRAAPSWDSDSIEIFLWFIPDDLEGEITRDDLIQQVVEWMKIIPATGRYKSVEGVVASLEDMTARDYIESDPLDVDHLSIAVQSN